MQTQDFLITALYDEEEFDQGSLDDAENDKEDTDDNEDPDWDDDTENLGI